MKPWLIVGLGNPGEQYVFTRHNVGYAVVEHLAHTLGSNWARHKCGAPVSAGRLGVLPGGVPGPPVILAKPGTFMNVSGKPVAALAKFYGVEPARIAVVHDDLDLEEDRIKLKIGGGEGGHNGLKSISAALGTREYNRIRVGIGRPPGRQNPSDYVLAKYPAKARESVGVTVALAAEATEYTVLNGLLKAQLKYHGS